MTRHPAKFSDDLLPIMDVMLGSAERILDPFAGVGKLRLIRPNAVLNEIEPEWIGQADGSRTIGDATFLPFADDSFDAICTSPVYGNRMSDSFIDHKPEKNYRRNTYTHAIGRKLHDRNTGKMQWGDQYRHMHESAWSECRRVLKNNGIFVLNISDHIRNRERVNVSDWHIKTLANLDFMMYDIYPVKTRRNRQGENRELRVDYEYVIRFRLES